MNTSLFSICKEKIGNRKVCIWGTWELGISLQRELSKFGIEIDFFIDSYASVEVIGHPLKKVYRPNILNKEECFVFVSTIEHESIYSLLEEKGYSEYEDYVYLCKVIEIHNIKHGYRDYYENSIQGDIQTATVKISGAQKLLLVIVQK